MRRGKQRLEVTEIFVQPSILYFAKFLDEAAFGLHWDVENLVIVRNRFIFSICRSLWLGHSQYQQTNSNQDRTQGGKASQRNQNDQILLTHMVIACIYHVDIRTCGN